MEPTPPARHSKVGTALATLLGAACLIATGCGTPGPPQPPSLHLPNPVSDLTAVRSGATVTLHWTNPRKTTDRLLINGTIHARICWQKITAQCEVVEQVDVQPGTKVDFRESVPPALQQGEPRPVSFFVELQSSKARSAGPSNLAPILAGAAPQPLTGLRGEPRPNGAALHWDAGDNTLVRLHRKLLTPTKPPSDSSKNPLGGQSEPLLRDFLIEPGPIHDGALDATAQFGNSYEYTAQRLTRITVNGQTVELAGDVSAPIRIDMVDTFPPAVPSGLEAVAVPDKKTIDLSWQPNSDSDLAGYIVYRADDSDSTAWTPLSGPQPLTAPAYRDTSVQTGHTYRYAVTAVDLSGHESARSTETRESLPNPQ